MSKIINLSRRHTLWCCGGGAVAVALGPWGVSVAADAAGYPTKTIEMLVGFAPGGGTDVVARLLSKKLTEAWKQSVVVTNRPGASGNIANDLVAKARPDGYTLLVAVSSLVINPSLYKDLPYDTIRDLTPVSLVSQAPNVIAANPNVPVHSAKEMIELARSRPGEISYASPGNGQASQLAMELLGTMSGVKFLHVPFNGGGPSVSAVLGGHTQLIVGSLPTILPAIRSGSLRAIGVTSATRTKLAPEIPTIAEQTGLTDYDAIVWYGMLAPGKTPQPIIDKLNAEVGRILEEKEVRDHFASIGFETAHNSPAEFAALIKAEIDKWAKVVRDSSAKID
jgi:tripartite-type tricarboxylate transporter receptor subunit TctC